MIAIPVKVGGTFSKPTMGVDIESLVRGKAEQTIKGLLDKALKPKGDDAATGEGTADGGAGDILKGILGGGNNPAAGETPAEDGPTGAAATGDDPADALVKQGIGALFGNKKPAEKPAEDADQPD
ncbi:MAG: hypothetical protein HXY23_05875 [Parvularculaceae bacterium]|nr:hypothetical protein [Parvularculaceae bacterium]